MGSDMDTATATSIAKHDLLAFAIILAAGAIVSVVARRLKVPDIVIFLLVGILLGPEVLGLLDIPTDAAVNQVILIFGSSYLLFDGGASLRFKVLKEVWISIVVLATAGVLVTALITSVAANYVLGIPYIVALLLGAAIASTDPATLVPIFRQVRIRDRVAQTVVSESAFNDATGAVTTFAVLAIAAGTGEFSLSSSMINFFTQCAIGMAAGAILGYTAAFLIGHHKYNFLMEYAPLVTLMAVIGAYLSADKLYASGFMAVFVFGMVLGNKESFGFRMSEEETERLDEFIMTTTLITRMFIFILLGSQVNFALMNRYLAGGIIVVTIFMLIARPVAVFVCTLPDRRAKWNLNEMLFMCWTRETGVIPAALAGILVGLKAPGADVIASITFIAILMTILIQATTTRWLASKLGLLLEQSKTDRRRDGNYSHGRYP
jgi:potassium/hydrogen antiporter